MIGTRGTTREQITSGRSALDQFEEFSGEASDLFGGFLFWLSK